MAKLELSGQRWLMRVPTSRLDTCPLLASVGRSIRGDQPDTHRHLTAVKRPGHRMLMRWQFRGLERSGLSDLGALVLKEPSTGSRHLLPRLVHNRQTGFFFAQKALRPEG